MGQESRHLGCAPTFGILYTQAGTPKEQLMFLWNWSRHYQFPIHRRACTATEKDETRQYFRKSQIPLLFLCFIYPFVVFRTAAARASSHRSRYSTLPGEWSSVSPGTGETPALCQQPRKQVRNHCSHLLSKVKSVERFLGSPFDE